MASKVADFNKLGVQRAFKDDNLNPKGLKYHNIDRGTYLMLGYLDPKG